MIITPTPASLGFRMPAEWETHKATWLSWPHKLESWPGKFEPVPYVFLEMVKNLVPYEHVNINVKDQEMQNQVAALLQEGGVDLSKVTLHLIPTNDTWCRDHGPMFIKNKNGDREIVDWGYNAWGGKYPPFDDDDIVPTRIAEKYGMKVHHPGIVMEGGSIELNGKGTLLTSKACLLNPNRNPHLNQKQIEDYLSAYLGVTHFLWVGDGIDGDDTDGHIDDMTRFVNATTIVTAIEENPEDPNYEPLQENLALLKTFKDQDGKPFNIVTIPMPAAVEFDDQRLPASYANFYIANKVVLVPVYRDPVNDKIALDTLQSLFTDRKVVGIDCTDLVWGLGAIHCVTQQEPA